MVRYLTSIVTAIMNSCSLKADVRESIIESIFYLICNCVTIDADRK